MMRGVEQLEVGGGNQTQEPLKAMWVIRFRRRNVGCEKEIQAGLHLLIILFLLISIWWHHLPLKIHLFPLGNIFSYVSQMIDPLPPRYIFFVFSLY
jgi:hypothetical protein